MAAPRIEPNGTWRIQVICPDGVRRPIRLPKMRASAASEIGERIEALRLAKKVQQLPDKITQEWAANISTDLHNRLAKCGLVDRRINQESTALQAFLDGYLTSRKDLQPNSLRNMRNVRNKLVELFGPNKALSSFIAGDGTKFKQWMLTYEPKPYSLATTSKAVKFARGFFKIAIDDGLCTLNPFRGVKFKRKAEQNEARIEYVDRETINKVIEATPDIEWKLIIALSRFAGLRCPSEHLSLEWDDVNWAESLITIRAPKTGDRLIPIFEDLKPYLEKQWEQTPTGEKYVIRKHRDANINLRTQFQRIIKKAGVKSWEKLFHNLRSSCQNDLAEEYPLRTVCDWIGNSPTVAMAHYLKAQQHHFDKATGKISNEHKHIKELTAVLAVATKDMSAEDVADYFKRLKSQLIENGFIKVC